MRQRKNPAPLPESLKEYQRAVDRYYAQPDTRPEKPTPTHPPEPRDAE